jgi:hypothetical protein
VIKLNFNLQQEYHIKLNPNMAICDIRSSRIHYHFWYIQANWHPAFLSMLIMNPSRFITFMIHLQFDWDKSCSLSLIQPLILLCIIKENNDIFLELKSQTLTLLRANNQIKTNIKVYCPWRMPPNHTPMLHIYSLVSHTFITKDQLLLMVNRKIQFTTTLLC